MTECTKQQHTTNKEIKKYKIKHKTARVKNYSLEFIIWSCTENALRKISYGHWYYTQANCVQLAIAMAVSQSLVSHYVKWLDISQNFSHLLQNYPILLIRYDSGKRLVKWRINLPSSVLLHYKLTVLHRLYNKKITFFMLCHTFTLLKFIFVEDKKQKLCRSVIANGPLTS